MTDVGPLRPRADPLGEALHFLRMNGAFYSHARLTAPWGMSLEPMPGYMWFHVPTAGELWVDASAIDPVRVRPGELVLVPHGEGHRLRSEPGAATPDVHELDLEWVSDRYEIIRHGGGGDPTTLICGAVRFDHPVARNLVEILPPSIHIQASESPQVERMQSTLALLAAEARETRPGGEAVITRLADILVIQAIRSWLETDPAARTGWLGAVNDPQIGHAISLIHAEPERAWTVASLAQATAMSRSAFAARFSRLVEQPAMEYVTRWRMQVAAEALREGGPSVAEVADQLGYRSEAAFARAFKRVLGVPPGAVRRAGPVTAAITG
jgi:AraC-like DNA-binding protein